MSGSGTQAGLWAVVGLLVGLVLWAPAGEAYGADVALQVALVDDFSTGANLVHHRRQELERAGFLVKDVLIDVTTRRLSLRTKRWEQKIREQLRGGMAGLNLGPDDHVRVIVIYASAATDDTTLRLDGIGVVSESDADADFKEVFDPVRPWISDDLRVVLWSSGAFKGSEQSVRQKARALLTYLGARDGSVFGATTAVGDGVTEPRWLPTWSQLKVYAFFYAFAADALLMGQILFAGPFQGPVDFVSKFFVLPAVLVYMFHAGREGLKQPLTENSAKARRSHWGRLVELVRGRVARVVELSLHNDSHRLFESCQSRMQASRDRE